MKNKWYNKIEEYVGAWMLLVMTIITVVNVCSRYIFHSTISASEEIVALLFVLLSLFGSAVAIKRKAHLGLTILTERCSPKAASILIAIGYFLGAVFGVILVVTGVDMVKTALEYNTVTLAMNWPEWIFDAFVPIGGVAITIRFLQMAILELKKDGGDEE
jgi:C4-dicarboxylate transporter DctQ subunit